MFHTATGAETRKELVPFCMYLGCLTILKIIECIPHLICFFIEILTSSGIILVWGLFTASAGLLLTYQAHLNPALPPENPHIQKKSYLYSDLTFHSGLGPRREALPGTIHRLGGTTPPHHAQEDD